MDMNHNILKSVVNTNDLHIVEPPKNEERECDDDESQTLLSKKSEIPKRKVQWLDKNGDKLAEILEFQPSDVSDSDEEDSDSCICTIM
ncbi:hypothetical protein PHJA_003007200 [Phtheirospermum japonicum]|uniref:Uncharacterized protein n=1 Tax=Phtheirospermum japonicum TaxID=374723 RepID=A0A830DSJ5_9LAMI|nr:hypothetical protein PHJA_003007200 [Phtheirospermum japonicum]